MEKETAYQVRISFKPKTARFKPSSVMGIVVAKNKKEALEYANIQVEEWAKSEKIESETKVSIIKTIPSSFIMRVKR